MGKLLNFFKPTKVTWMFFVLLIAVPLLSLWLWDSKLLKTSPSSFVILFSPLPQRAGSGHPTSSFFAMDLMACLLFGGFFRFDVKNPSSPINDRLIFSKGHASPLFYAIWAVAGAIEEKELLTLRQFGSRLEGHPTMAFPYTEAATGSLGQGLSIGVGMALRPICG